MYLNAVHCTISYKYNLKRTSLIYTQAGNLQIYWCIYLGYLSFLHYALSIGIYYLRCKGTVPELSVVSRFIFRRHIQKALEDRRCAGESIYTYKCG